MSVRHSCARSAGERRGLGAATVALSLAAWLAAAGGAGCDWQSFRGSPDGRGAAPEAAIYVPDVDVLTHRWAAKTTGAITGAAVTAGDTVYVGSSSGTLYAFDTASGERCVKSPETCVPLWTAQTGGPIHGAPAIGDDVVYVGSSDGKLYAFDLLGERSCAGSPGKCAPLWTGATGAAIRSSPTIANGVLYVGSDDFRLYAFDAIPAAPCPPGADGLTPTCAPKWAAPTGGKVFSSPAVANGSVYVGSDDGSLYAFDAAPDLAVCAPGNPRLCPARWRGPTGGAVASSPAATATTVYVGSTDGKLYAFDASGKEACGGSPLTCSPRWWAKTGGPIYASPAVSAGRVFIGSLDSKLYAFAATPSAPCGEAGCAPEWTARLGNVVTSSAVVAHGFVVVGSWDGDVYAFDVAGDGCDGEPKMCRPRWSASTGSAVVASPIVSYGRVIVGTADGVLHLWERPVGEWQQFRGGPSHQGITTTESALRTTNVHELHAAWTGMTGASIFSSPAVVGGVVYVGSDDGKLYAFDAAGTTPGANCIGSPKACEPLWTAQPGGGGIVVAGSPAVVDGIVHVATSAFVHYGNVFAYDAAGIRNCAGTPKVCEPIWRARMSSFVDNAAMVWRGVVYYADGYGKVAAFDASGVKGCSGTPTVCQPLWTAQAGPGAHGSPTLYKGRVFVGSDNGNVYAFDANGTDGCAGTPKVCEPLWIAATGEPSGLYATPAVSDGVLYVASLQGAAYAFDANGLSRCAGTPRVCAPLWKALGTAGTYSSPAVSSERVFFSAGGRLLAYDKRGVAGCLSAPDGSKTCSPLWETRTAGAYAASPAIAGGVLYIGSLDKKLYAYDVAGTKGCSGTPKVCQPLWSWATGEMIWSSPTVAGGRVYVGSSDFKLWAFER